MKHIKAFFLGLVEFKQDMTTHFDNDGLLETYDAGRELMHRLTLRRYDNAHIEA